MSRSRGGAVIKIGAFFLFMKTSVTPWSELRLTPARAAAHIPVQAFFPYCRQCPGGVLEKKSKMNKVTSRKVS